MGFDEWNVHPECSGFTVSSDCPYRYYEMELISYTPEECLEETKTMGCEELRAYARF